MYCRLDRRHEVKKAEDALFRLKNAASSIKLFKRSHIASSLLSRQFCKSLMLSICTHEGSNLNLLIRSLINCFNDNVLRREKALKNGAIQEKSTQLSRESGLQNRWLFAIWKVSFFGGGD
jgi:hypothetical protein